MTEEKIDGLRRNGQANERTKNARQRKTENNERKKEQKDGLMKRCIERNT